MERKVHPNVSAEAWAVYDVNANKFLYAENAEVSREIASLTKIMTAYTVLEISDAYSIDIKSEIVTVGSNAALTMGSTAGLLLGEKLSVYDMLHGLLLPSGNDAGVALAEHFGKLLQSKSTSCTQSEPSELFIKRMNDNAKSLSLANTNFTNPHGLPDSFNRSTAFDVALLSAVCMKNGIFAEMVGKLKHTCYGLSSIGASKKLEWCQTNRLLWKGFNGIKTGTTNAAGICLSASYKDAGVWLIIVVLGCKNPYRRWEDTVQLKELFLKKAMTRKESNKKIVRKVVRQSSIS